MLLGLQSFTTHFTWTQWSGATGQRELWEGGGAQDFKFRAEISIFFFFFFFLHLEETPAIELKCLTFATLLNAN